MLKDLKILNGNLELKYNEYTYEYTVTVDNDVNSLEFEYVLDDDCYVDIKDNNLEKGENIVTLDVYNVDNSITYTFYVYKESEEEVNGIDNYMKSLEVANTNNTEFYKVQILSVSLFFPFCFIRKKFLSKIRNFFICIMKIFFL